MKNYKIIFLLLLASTMSFAQPQSSDSAKLVDAYQQKEELTKSSRVKNIHFRNIGPTIMSGRVVALEVNPKDPTKFYVAYASGGVWYTDNNGTSFKSISEDWPTQNIGEITMDWKNKILWVGTGENNSSRSSYSGIGILKTEPNGSNWVNVGLTDSHHIGKILINPTNKDHVIVGVTGHLYSKNNNRGVYVTKDGGITWKKTLYIDDGTGIIDMAYTPNSFNIMYATAWEKDRKAWNLNEGGNSSAIYKSIDAGETWYNISKEDSGFPVGDGVGRIGIAVFDENIIYAVLDNQFFRTRNSKQNDEGLGRDSFKNMSIKEFNKISDKDLKSFLRSNRFPSKYTVERIKSDIDDEKISPSDLNKYLVDANSELFNTPIIGAEVYRSDDGGNNWTKTHETFLDGVYNTYGYYFGKIHVDPSNSDKIYTYGVPIITSDDGGKSFYRIGKENVHADHHDLWINPNKPGHLINGNDGGVNITYDDGKNWIKNNSTEVGQFYAINVDYDKPYNVYGGLQDNGVWKGPHNSIENKRWNMNGKYPWEMIMGGDGMEVQIDNRDSNTVYTGFQFGFYYRLELDSGKRKSIKPVHELGESPYRFNWQTPILLSPHNQDIVYFGTNHFHKSNDKGDSWQLTSKDLTNGGKKGNVPYGTITTIAESPIVKDLLYVGTDDGLIHVSKNGGKTWKNISQNLPQDMWVSKVYASSHNEKVIYASLNGYRWDNFSPYLYKSENYGKTWTSISSNLPDSPINVVIEDNINQNILYVGNDHGVYVSLDSGINWEPFSSGLTSAAVHDLVIQKDENHLLIGTHGRSIYLTEIEKIQGLSDEILNSSLYVYPLKSIKKLASWGVKRSIWSESNNPNLELTIFSSSKKEYQLSIIDSEGNSIYNVSDKLDRGFNFVDYNLRHNQNNNNDFLDKGSYKVLIITDKDNLEKEFQIK
ncbi:MAG: glycosyl hydrolase [Flavobacteriaceae bacterium]|nr:glycosyl hydrolase [Flavobacteriaceae bacterium]MDG2500001.1 glycosyl hydrolase [Flavobacteriaceae bacterium]